MVNVEKKTNCCGCEACYSICPTKAIQMKQDCEGFFYPEIDKIQCISCDKCESVCPIIQKNVLKAEKQKAYACFNKDDSIRSQSTSGGIFTAIAEYLIEKKNALVYGVAFDENFDVVYKKACKKEEIEIFRGSKYVQCRAANIYSKIQNELSEGQCVLFTGVPCQIEALICFLGKTYSNLYTIDMVCFGIGSPMLWKNYLNEFHNVNEIEEIVFKDKIDGWKHWKIKFVEAGKQNYYERADNLYMNSYLKKINIRPSCFQCEFKGLDRKSDFTIADCWGIGEQNSRMNDDRGLSALLLHTKKARFLFEAIKEQMVFEEYEPHQLMEGNWAAFKPPVENVSRKGFFEDLEKGDFKSNFIKFFG